MLFRSGELEARRRRLAEGLRALGHGEVVDAHEAALRGETRRPFPPGRAADAARAARAAMEEALEQAPEGRLVMTHCEEDPCLVSIAGAAAAGGRTGILERLRAAGHDARPSGRASRLRDGTWVWTVPVPDAPSDVFSRARVAERLVPAHAAARSRVRPTERR